MGRDSIAGRAKDLAEADRIRKEIAGSRDRAGRQCYRNNVAARLIVEFEGFHPIYRALKNGRAKWFEGKMLTCPLLLGARSPLPP